MYNRASKVIKERLVEFLKNIFQKNTRWENEEIDVVEIVSERDKPLSFESFFREPEQYPVIFLQSTSLVKQELDLNNFLGQVSYSEDYTPTAIDLVKTIGGSDTLKQALYILPQKSFKLDHTKTRFRNVSVSTFPLTTQLSSGSTPEQFFMASGSTDRLTTNKDIQVITVDMVPKVTLASGSSYWVSYSTDSGSTYNQYQVFGSNNPATGTGLLTSEFRNNVWSVAASGSFATQIFEAPSLRLGGANDVTITFTVVSKDFETTEDITELVGNYLELARYTETT